MEVPFSFYGTWTQFSIQFEHGIDEGRVAPSLAESLTPFVEYGRIDAARLKSEGRRGTCGSDCCRQQSNGRNRERTVSFEGHRRPPRSARDLVWCFLEWCRGLRCLFWHLPFLDGLALLQEARRAAVGSALPGP